MKVWILISWMGIQPLFATQVSIPENLIRERNLGIAHFHNEDFSKAAEHFLKASELSKHEISDQINLGLSYLKADNPSQAIPVLIQAKTQNEDHPFAQYLLALSFSRTEDFLKAKEEWKKMIQLDPLCAPAYYQLGVALKNLEAPAEAIQSWKETLKLEPNHSPAYYSLFTQLTQLGKTKEAQWALEGFNRTKKEQGGSGWSREDVERSRYTQLILDSTMFNPEKKGNPKVQLQKNSLDGLPTQKTFAPILFADFDGDQDFDLIWGNQLFQKNSSSFTEITSSGLSLEENLKCIETGDINGDGQLDLFFCQGSKVLLYRGKGNFQFEKISSFPETSCGLNKEPTQIRLVDFDHEGDLDALILCSEKTFPFKGRVVLLQNNGNETFKNVTIYSQINTGGKKPSQVVLSDFDQKNDIDFLFSFPNQNPEIFFNLRDGRFKKSVLPFEGTDSILWMASGDLNGDTKTDLVTLHETGKIWVWNNQGPGTFFKDPGAALTLESVTSMKFQTGSLFDIDNDGDLDLFLAGGKTENGMAIFRNDGIGGWIQESSSILSSIKENFLAQNVFANDVDQDGDQDLFLFGSNGAVEILKNQGGNKNRVLRIRLNGRKNNSDGYGVKLQVKDGAFSVFRENFSRWIDIGIGNRKKIEVLEVRWPTGIEQSHIDIATKKNPHVLDVAERPGLAESCPFVYAFNGKKFEFVSDILDTTPVGVSLIPGQPFYPNNREAILIEGNRLKPSKDGSLHLKITQELAEITYLDQVELYVVDHPKESRILPNDRFSEKPFNPFQIHFVPKPRFPKEAIDSSGRDVRKALLAVDRQYAFEVPYVSPKYPGVTKKWELILDPGEIESSQDVWLFLRGTMLWSDASVNFATYQNPSVEVLPISLDVLDSKGKWKRVAHDLGVPAGINKFLPIPISKFVKGLGHKIRLSSTYAILWDQAFFSIQPKTNPEKNITFTKLLPNSANLQYGGFSAPYSPDGKLPDLYNAQQKSPTPLYPILHAGFYTRLGDVRNLLLSAEDEYVVLAPGDELNLQFKGSLPPILEGWKRDYILETHGFIKDGDWRTIFPSTIEPLPFHGMKKYPSQYPFQKHKAYLETYQTRMIPKDLWISKF